MYYTGVQIPCGKKHFGGHMIDSLWTTDSSSAPATKTYVQIPLNGPDHTVLQVGFGRVVFRFHYMDPTRPDPRTARVSDKSADFVWS